MVSQRIRSELFKLLFEVFSNEELNALCFDLGVDHEQLPDLKEPKARELVSFLDRRGRLAELVAAGRSMRPEASWPTIDVEGGEGEAAPRPAFVNAPPLPPNFIERPEELDALRRAVLAKGSRRGVALTALRGMGGIGKSTLAQALCCDPAVQAAFPDGILWLNIGPDLATLPARVTEAGLALDPDYRSEYYATLELGASRLRAALHDRAALIVLDNVWDVRQVDPFRTDAPKARLLFTTRDSGIALAVGAVDVPLDILQPEQAVDLLHEWAGRDDPELRALADRVGYLPLALRLAGARLKEGMSAREWLDTFHEVWQMRLGQRSTDPQENVLVSIQLSEDRLAEVDRRLYHALGIFPRGAPISVRPIYQLWRGLDPRLSDFTCHELLTDLSRLQLLSYDLGKGQAILHDLLGEYARETLGGDVRAAHSALLAAYNPSSAPWYTVSDDGSLYNILAYHLVGAGRGEDLRKLLLDYSWLEARLRAGGPSALIADYDVALREGEDQALVLMKRTVRQAMHILAQDAGQLVPQLFGRLLNVAEPCIQELLQRAEQAQLRPWLRPLSASLRESAALVRTFAGHTDAVLAVAISPDGRYAVSGARDNSVRVWDLLSGQEKATLTGHSYWVSAVAVTQDGRYAVSGSYDSTLKVWNLSTGLAVRTMAGHRNFVSAVAVTSDGRYAVSGSNDHTLKVWDLSTGLEVRTLIGHSDAVSSVAVTSDGHCAVSGSADRSIVVWDLSSGRMVRSMSGHTEPILAVAITPDQRYVISGSIDKTLKVWDLITGSEVRTLGEHGNGIAAVAVTPDGRHAISGSWDSTVKVWDLSNGSELRTLTGHSTWVSCVSITPDGSQILSGSCDETLRMWNLSSDDRDQAPTAGHRNWVSAVAIAPDGRYAVSGSWDQTLIVWDRSSAGRELMTLKGHSKGVSAIAIRSDGCRAVSGSWDNTLRVWDLATGREARTPLEGHRGGVTAVAIMKDQRSLISGSADATLKIWNMENGTEQATLVGHLDAIRSVAITPDGRYVISGSHDKMLKVWGLPDGTDLATLTGHEDWVNAVAITPDGRYAVSGSQDTMIKIWDWANGKEQATLIGHAAPVLAVTVTPDGDLIVSGASDGTLRVWDLRQAVARGGEGCEQAVLDACAAVRACAVAPDGRSIVAGDAAGRVHFLRLEGMQRSIEAGETPKERQDRPGRRWWIFRITRRKR